MLKWILIGVVLWYFYRRFSKKMTLGKGDDRNDFPDHRSREKTYSDTRDEDFIDYEEVD